MSTKDARLELRLTQKELDNVKKIAQKKGLTMSDLIRLRLFGEK